MMNFPTITKQLISVKVDQNIHLWSGKTFTPTFASTKKKKKFFEAIKVLFASYFESTFSDFRCLETFFLIKEAQIAIANKWHLLILGSFFLLRIKIPFGPYYYISNSNHIELLPLYIHSLFIH